jgi:hypothetical protein
LAGLAGKAVKRAAVIGDKEPHTTERPRRGRSVVCALSCRHRRRRVLIKVLRLVLECGQPHTHCTRAIGALSPERGPSLRIRR